MSENIKMSANSIQVGGDHYKSRRLGQQEHWDIVATHGLDYFQGQVTKYTMRWKKKGGVQDLKKALHFLQKYIELVEANIITDPVRSKAVHDAIHPIPIPTTPPFVGAVPDYSRDGAWVQQSSSRFNGPTDNIPEQVSAGKVGADHQSERDSVGQQNLPNLGTHIQRIQADGPPVGVSGGSVDYRHYVPEQRSGRESTSPAEHGSKSEGYPQHYPAPHVPGSSR